MIRLILYLTLLVLSALACTTPKRSAAAKLHHLKMSFDTSRVFSKGITGFILQDAGTGQVIYGIHPDNYFTPASNTKILTLAVCLQSLGDSLDALEYTRADNRLVFRGTGDPTFLHPSFEHWQPAYRFLTTVPDTQQLIYSARPFPEKRFGPGWAWEDFADYYQPEKSVFPIYGNVVTISSPEKLTGVDIQPSYFKEHIHSAPNATFIRQEDKNEWFIDKIPPGKTKLVPFLTSSFVPLLQDTLHRPIVAAGDNYDTTNWETIRSVPTDTVLRLMMYESDNFLAEQLLIMAGQKRAQTMRQDSIIRLAVNTILPYSATPPRWVDGSGLSRYNLITPRYLADVLYQLYHTVPAAWLFPYFPAGGVSGTISRWYSNPDGQSFVFAKSGSMSGVNCLSGYILTKIGKVMIISFIHNNFVGTNKPWKQQMQQILQWVYQNY